MRIFKNHAPITLTYKQLKENGNTGLSKCPNSENWIPARSYPYHDNLWARLRCAWLVFTGKADALLPVWQEKPDDLADLLRAATRKPACGEGRHG